MKYLFIASIGCVRRHLDCERIKNYFRANQVALTSSPEKADYLYISTCGLTRLHEDLSIDDILRFKRCKGELIVGGCLPEMNSARLKSVFDGKTISTKDLELIGGLFPEFTVKFKDVADGNRICLSGEKRKVNYFIRRIKETDFYWFLKPLNAFREFHKKYIAGDPAGMRKSFPGSVAPMPLIDFNNNFFSLRVSSGCLGGCSYCNIKKAIGRLRSKPLALIRDELKKAISGRQYKLNIISSDSGSYGLDLNSTLPEMLGVVLGADKRMVIEYLGNLHPVWICRYKSELLPLLKTGRIKSMMTAVQSGSARILGLMGRDANLAEFKIAIKEMKAAYPRLRLRTQIIIGFPAETDADLQDTIDLIRECRFDEVDTFCYYETDTMESAKILPKVPAAVARKRMREVRKRLPVSIAVNYFN